MVTSIVAAGKTAGLIALEEIPHRLGEGHGNARFLVNEIAIPKIRLDPASARTNTVAFAVSATGAGCDGVYREVEARRADE